MSKKIMIVDDAAFMRMMIKDTLSKNGFDSFVEAGDGQIALGMYEQERPDLVIMDITMPNMNGIQALQAIKALDDSARVIMCSAMGQEAMVVEAIRLGALDFIVKPFKSDRILQTVNKVLA
ncbi:response regulator [Hydrogenoanaerobacterium sp.]|uniref:response regulator n=1 Tax=Hydrogenoanaerobacterium sp. TaxID=2953763 RepID=UPI00289B360D|nr:response regulator [Hydrogenoanaerobacterium sp.]